jgi:pilus assembly protein CpaE
MSACNASGEKPLRTDGIPHSAANVVVVGVKDDTMGKVREILAAEAVLPNASVSYEDGLDAVLHAYPDVVLVGMDSNPEQAEEFARLLYKERVRAMLVAIASQRDANAILSAMRAGYNEYVVLPEDAAQLRSAVHGAAFDLDDDDSKGIIVAVTGAKGGVGATMLATHLAAELASIHRVACLDFDFTMGDIAPAMDIIPKDTIADLLPRAETIDERMLTGSASVHPSKVHFICQPNDIDQIGDLHSDEIFNILNAAAGAYQYVIVDCGSRLDDATTTTLNVADQVFVIATPDVVSVRDCHRKLNALSALGVERKRVSVILNRVPRQPYLTRETIEQNLSINIVGSVSDDPRHVDHALNEGKLIRDLYPKSDIVTEIARLVGLLTDDPEELEAAAEEQYENQSFFARLFNR